MFFLHGQFGRMSQHPHKSEELQKVKHDLTEFLEQPFPLTAVFISGNYQPAPAETFSHVDHVKRHMQVLQDGLALSLKAIIEMQKSLESLARVLTTGINERQMQMLCQSLFLASIQMLGDPKNEYDHMGVAGRLRTMASQLEQAQTDDPQTVGDAPSVVVPGLCADEAVVCPGALRVYAGPARIVADAAVDTMAVQQAREKVVQVEPRDWRKEREEIESFRAHFAELLRQTVFLRMNGGASLTTAVVTDDEAYSLLPDNGGRQVKLIADLPPALREGIGYDLLSGWPFQKNSAHAVLGKRPAADSPAREQNSAAESLLERCKAHGRELARLAAESSHIVRLDEEELARRLQTGKSTADPPVSALPQMDGAASEDEAEGEAEDEDDKGADEDDKAEDKDDKADKTMEGPAAKKVKFAPSAPPARAMFRGIGHRARCSQRRQKERREEPRAEPRGWPVDLTKHEGALPLYEWAALDMDVWNGLAPFTMDPAPHGYNLNVTIGRKLVPRPPPRLLTRWELAKVLQEAADLHAEHTALVAGLREDQKRDRARDITPEDLRWEELFARLQRLGYPLFTNVPIDPDTQNFFGSHY